MPVRERLHEQNDRRIFTVFEALKAGVSVEKYTKLPKSTSGFCIRSKISPILKTASPA
jgi:hypothetical protein